MKERKAIATRSREARVEAANWASELNATGASDDPKLSEAFAMFVGDNSAGRRPSTLACYELAIQSLINSVGDLRLSAIDETLIRDWRRDLSTGGRTLKAGVLKRRSLETVAHRLRHAKAFLNWCRRERLVARVPNFESVKRPAARRGRSLSGEEVDRIVEAIGRVRPASAPQWRFLIRLLEASGLRLAEGMALSWDEVDPVAVVDFGTDRARIVIDGSFGKSGRTDAIPIVPELQALLNAVPSGDRVGRVVKLRMRRVNNASAVISEAGRLAGVRTGANTFATAHDLRRRFCTVWAARLSAQQLQKLARHAALQTTLAFYIDGDAGLFSAVSRFPVSQSEQAGELAPRGESRTLENA